MRLLPEQYRFLKRPDRADRSSLSALVLMVLSLSTLFLFSAKTEAQFANVQPTAGDPAPGLTEAQLTRFWEGREAFVRPITVEEGLGPLFNKASCAGCHDSPVGGAGTVTVVSFGRAQGASFGCGHCQSCG